MKIRIRMKKTNQDKYSSCSRYLTFKLTYRRLTLTEKNTAQNSLIFNNKTYDISETKTTELNTAVIQGGSGWAPLKAYSQTD